MKVPSRAALALWTGLVAASPGLAAEPDYSGYAQLLSEYLVKGRLWSSETPANPALLTGVDYARLRGPRARTWLEGIRAALLASAPSRMTHAERTAWAINTYNFLVIERVASHLDERDGKLGSVMDVTDFFDAPVVEVEREIYSLNTFERHFLFADFDRKSGPPPAALDPRVHFAIVCAARGCPPLAAHPYRAATLDRDLDDITRRALLGRVHTREDKSSGRFAISSIFDWYEKDFGGRAGVIAFLRRYGPSRLRAALGSRGPQALSGFIPWDWGLNQSKLPPAR